MITMILRFLFWFTLAMLAGHLTTAQTPEPTYNYDEAKVGTFTLPNPLIDEKGKPVKTTRQWRNRRVELLQLFSDYVYGQTPKQAVKLRFQTNSVDTSALNGLATRKLISIFFVDYPQLPPINVLVYSPNRQKAAPVFVGLNFSGNHCISSETDIPLPASRRTGTHPATDKERGSQVASWPVGTLLQRGYALATAYYGNIEPDSPAGWHAGIRSVLGDTTKANNWSAMGAWAWGMSRIVDYLQTDPAIDARRVIAFGHSRIGKAAIWAGAQDERFAAVVANESGEGGAALTRRWYGETIERVNTSFPNWFCTRYKDYSQRPAALPVDQHEVLALIAPRPLYVASADGDQWSDPKGEFLGAVNAEPVYHLYGKTGLGTSTFPALNQSIGHTIRYHDRTGKHDVTAYDWEQYLRFADELVN